MDIKKESIRSSLLILPLVASLNLLTTDIAQADSFDKYRMIIDNYHTYNVGDISKAIIDFEKEESADVEKNYLLGMLYFIRGFVNLREIGRSSPVKIRVEDALENNSVQSDFRYAEDNYDLVEQREPGYKLIYCKYAELYRYSFNGEGLDKITRKVGRVPQNERTQQCKASLEDIAEGYARYGYANLSRVIYKAAVLTWNPYPKYMLEAIGDIEDVRDNEKEAKMWWKRCVQEADTPARKERCLRKVNKAG